MANPPTTEKIGRRFAGRHFLEHRAREHSWKLEESQAVSLSKHCRTWNLHAFLLEFEFRYACEKVWSAMCARSCSENVWLPDIPPNELVAHHVTLAMAAGTWLKSFSGASEGVYNLANAFCALVGHQTGLAKARRC